MSKQLEQKVAKLTKVVAKQQAIIEKLAKKQGINLTKRAQVSDVVNAEPEIRGKFMNAVLGFGVTGLTLSLGMSGDNFSVEKVVVQCPENADVFAIKNKLMEVAKTLDVGGKKVEISNPNFLVAEHPATINVAK